MTAVLIVDDSALMRKHLSSLFKEAGMVVRTASNGADAVQEVLNNPPDVITLDVNMPQMDGLTALSQIMAARPTPVVMVSSLTAKGTMATLEALAMGAVDFIEKPGGTISLSLDAVAKTLVDKVSSAARARLAKPKPAAPAVRRVVEKPAPPVAKPPQVTPGMPDGLVLIGISTGGPKTLEEILPALPADLRWPVLVVQHMPASFTGPLANRLNQKCQLEVKEAAQFDRVVRGCIYIARGGTDLAVGVRNGVLVVINKPESPRYHWHPSVDGLVSSALECMPAARILGVQMTGMGNDGAEAMTDLKRRGGRTIAESEESSVVFGMPRELIERGGASIVLPSSAIAQKIIDWAR
ncbi:chemotaxis-specific protein-glutamate methyltransferase CheB [Rhizobium sp. RU36D]|uniref:chemotaxis-specific protein-glutamate methyltransferase CheB n=1 Tax=Rhizobium sp. RU36D TaxID=1907415 RepID=UPI0009D81D60|nr:chemotaxis-specific protein-glutamate methyltransferase CheB [Rhizobium sp. RU36D]SMC72774.1 two-component system, chemotaxis family, response regulator CheB [Rhizobium sp. RU36D]